MRLTNMILERFLLRVKTVGIPKTSQDADFEDWKLGIEIEGAFVYHTMIQFGFLCIFNPVLNGNLIPY